MKWFLFFLFLSYLPTNLLSIDIQLRINESVSIRQFYRRQHERRRFFPTNKDRKRSPSIALAPSTSLASSLSSYFAHKRNHSNILRRNQKSIVEFPLNFIENGYHQSRLSNLLQIQLTDQLKSTIKFTSNKFNFYIYENTIDKDIFTLPALSIKSENLGNFLKLPSNDDDQSVSFISLSNENLFDKTFENIKFSFTNIDFYQHLIEHQLNYKITLKIEEFTNSHPNEKFDEEILLKILPNECSCTKSFHLHQMDKKNIFNFKSVNSTCPSIYQNFQVKFDLSRKQSIFGLNREYRKEYKKRYHMKILFEPFIILRCSSTNVHENFWNEFGIIDKRVDSYYWLKLKTIQINSETIKVNINILDKNEKSPIIDYRHMMTLNHQLYQLTSSFENEERQIIVMIPILLENYLVNDDEETSILLNHKQILYQIVSIDSDDGINSEKVYQIKSYSQFSYKLENEWISSLCEQLIDIDSNSGILKFYKTFLKNSQLIPDDNDIFDIRCIIEVNDKRTYFNSLTNEKLSNSKSSKLSNQKPDNIALLHFVFSYDLPTIELMKFEKIINFQIYFKTQLTNVQFPQLCCTVLLSFNENFQNSQLEVNRRMENDGKSLIFPVSISDLLIIRRQSNLNELKEDSVIFFKICYLNTRSICSKFTSTINEFNLIEKKIQLPIQSPILQIPLEKYTNYNYEKLRQRRSIDGNDRLLDKIDISQIKVNCPLNMKKFFCIFSGKKMRKIFYERTEEHMQFYNDIFQVSLNEIGEYFLQLLPLRFTRNFLSLFYNRRHIRRQIRRQLTLFNELKENDIINESNALKKLLIALHTGVYKQIRLNLLLSIGCMGESENFYEASINICSTQNFNSIRSNFLIQPFSIKIRRTSFNLDVEYSEKVKLKIKMMERNRFELDAKFILSENYNRWITTVQDTQRSFKLSNDVRHEESIRYELEQYRSLNPFDGIMEMKENVLYLYNNSIQLTCISMEHSSSLYDKWLFSVDRLHVNRIRQFVVIFQSNSSCAFQVFKHISLYSAFQRIIRPCFRLLNKEMIITHNFINRCLTNKELVKEKNYENQKLLIIKDDKIKYHHQLAIKKKQESHCEKIFVNKNLVGEFHFKISSNKKFIMKFNNNNWRLIHSPTVVNEKCFLAEFLNLFILISNTNKSKESLQTFQPSQIYEHFFSIDTIENKTLFEWTIGHCEKFNGKIISDNSNVTEYFENESLKLKVKKSLMNLSVGRRYFEKISLICSTTNPLSIDENEIVHLNIIHNIVSLFNYLRYFLFHNDECGKEFDDYEKLFYRNFFFVKSNRSTNIFGDIYERLCGIEKIFKEDWMNNLIEIKFSSTDIDYKDNGLLNFKGNGNVFDISMKNSLPSPQLTIFQLKYIIVEEVEELENLKKEMTKVRKLTFYLSFIELTKSYFDELNIDEIGRIDHDFQLIIQFLNTKIIVREKLFDLSFEYLDFRPVSIMKLKVKEFLRFLKFNQLDLFHMMHINIIQFQLFLLNQKTMIIDYEYHLTIYLLNEARYNNIQLFLINNEDNNNIHRYNDTTTIDLWKSNNLNDLLSISLGSYIYQKLGLLTTDNYIINHSQQSFDNQLPIALLNYEISEINSNSSLPGISIENSHLQIKGYRQGFVKLKIHTFYNKLLTPYKYLNSLSNEWSDSIELNKNISHYLTMVLHFHENRYLKNSRFLGTKSEIDCIHQQRINERFAEFSTSLISISCEVDNFNTNYDEIYEEDYQLKCLWSLKEKMLIYHIQSREWIIATTSNYFYIHPITSKIRIVHSLGLNYLHFSKTNLTIIGHCENGNRYNKIIPIIIIKYDQITSLSLAKTNTPSSIAISYHIIESGSLQFSELSCQFNSMINTTNFRIFNQNFICFNEIFSNCQDPLHLVAIETNSTEKFKRILLNIFLIHQNRLCLNISLNSNIFHEYDQNSCFIYEYFQFFKQSISIVIEQNSMNYRLHFNTKQIDELLLNSILRPFISNKNLLNSCKNLCRLNLSNKNNDNFPILLIMKRSLQTTMRLSQIEIICRFESNRILKFNKMTIDLKSHYLTSYQFNNSNHFTIKLNNSTVDHMNMMVRLKNVHGYLKKLFNLIQFNFTIIFIPLKELNGMEMFSQYNSISNIVNGRVKYKRMLFYSQSYFSPDKSSQYDIDNELNLKSFIPYYYLKCHSTFIYSNFQCQLITMIDNNLIENFEFQSIFQSSQELTLKIVSETRSNSHGNSFRIEFLERNLIEIQLIDRSICSSQQLLKFQLEISQKFHQQFIQFVWKLLYENFDIVIDDNFKLSPIDVYQKHEFFLECFQISPVSFQNQILNTKFYFYSTNSLDSCLSTVDCTGHKIEQYKKCFKNPTNESCQLLIILHNFPDNIIKMQCNPFIFSYDDCESLEKWKESKGFNQFLLQFYFKSISNISRVSIKNCYDNCEFDSNSIVSLKTKEMDYRSSNGFCSIDDIWNIINSHSSIRLNERNELCTKNFCIQISDDKLDNRTIYSFDVINTDVIQDSTNEIIFSNSFLTTIKLFKRFTIVQKTPKINSSNQSQQTDNIEWIFNGNLMKIKSRKNKKVLENNMNIRIDNEISIHKIRRSKREIDKQTPEKPFYRLNGKDNDFIIQNNCSQMIRIHKTSNHLLLNKTKNFEISFRNLETLDINMKEEFIITNSILYRINNSLMIIDTNRLFEELNYLTSDRKEYLELVQTEYVRMKTENIQHIFKLINGQLLLIIDKLTELYENYCDKKFHFQEITQLIFNSIFTNSDEIDSQIKIIISILPQYCKKNEEINLKFHLSSNQQFFWLNQLNFENVNIDGTFTDYRLEKKPMENILLEKNMLNFVNDLPTSEISVKINRIISIQPNDEDIIIIDERKFDLRFVPENSMEQSVMNECSQTLQHNRLEYRLIDIDILSRNDNQFKISIFDCLDDNCHGPYIDWFNEKSSEIYIPNIYSDKIIFDECISDFHDVFQLKFELNNFTLKVGHEELMELLMEENVRCSIILKNMNLCQEKIYEIEFNRKRFNKRQLTSLSETNVIYMNHIQLAKKSSCNSKEEDIEIELNYNELLENDIVKSSISFYMFDCQSNQFINQFPFLMNVTKIELEVKNEVSFESRLKLFLYQFLPIHHTNILNILYYRIKNIINRLRCVDTFFQFPLNNENMIDILINIEKMNCSGEINNFSLELNSLNSFNIRFPTISLDAQNNLNEKIYKFHHFLNLTKIVQLETYSIIEGKFMEKMDKGQYYSNVDSSSTVSKIVMDIESNIPHQFLTFLPLINNRSTDFYYLECVEDEKIILKLDNDQQKKLNELFQVIFMKQNKLSISYDEFEFDDFFNENFKLIKRQLKLKENQKKLTFRLMGKKLMRYLYEIPSMEQISGVVPLSIRFTGKRNLKMMVNMDNMGDMEELFIKNQSIDYRYNLNIDYPSIFQISTKGNLLKKDSSNNIEIFLREFDSINYDDYSDNNFGILQFDVNPQFSGTGEISSIFPKIFYNLKLLNKTISINMHKVVLRRRNDHQKLNHENHDKFFNLLKFDESALLKIFFNQSHLLEELYDAESIKEIEINFKYFMKFSYLINFTYDDKLLQSLFETKEIFFDIVLKMKLIDVNDNPPKFQEHFTRLQLNEHSNIGTEIIQLTANSSDIDEMNNIITYRILEVYRRTAYSKLSYSLDIPANDTSFFHNELISPFSIDSTTGQLVVSNNDSLDYELPKTMNLQWIGKSSIFVIVVEASESEKLKDTTNLFVEILNLNDNHPKFIVDGNLIKLEIDEIVPTFQNNFKIFQFKEHEHVMDMDRIGNNSIGKQLSPFYFSIVTVKPAEASQHFHIRSENSLSQNGIVGELMLKKAIDYEKIPFFQLVIEVKNFRNEIIESVSNKLTFYILINNRRDEKLRLSLSQSNVCMKFDDINELHHDLLSIKIIDIDLEAERRFFNLMENSLSEKIISTCQINCYKNYLYPYCIMDSDFFHVQIQSGNNDVTFITSIHRPMNKSEPEIHLQTTGRRWQSIENNIYILSDHLVKYREIGIRTKIENEMKFRFLSQLRQRRLCLLDRYIDQDYGWNNVIWNHRNRSGIRNFIDELSVSKINLPIIAINNNQLMEIIRERFKSLMNCINTYDCDSIYTSLEIKMLEKNMKNLFLWQKGKISLKKKGRFYIKLIDENRLFNIQKLIEKSINNSIQYQLNKLKNSQIDLCLTSILNDVLYEINPKNFLIRSISKNEKEHIDMRIQRNNGIVLEIENAQIDLPEEANFEIFIYQHRFCCFNIEFEKRDDYRSNKLKMFHESNIILESFCMDKKLFENQLNQLIQQYIGRVCLIRINNFNEFSINHNSFIDMHVKCEEVKMRNISRIDQFSSNIIRTITIVEMLKEILSMTKNKNFNLIEQSQLSSIGNGKKKDENFEQLFDYRFLRYHVDISNILTSISFNGNNCSFNSLSWKEPLIQIEDITSNSITLPQLTSIIRNELTPDSFGTIITTSHIMLHTKLVDQALPLFYTTANDGETIKKQFNIPPNGNIHNNNFLNHHFKFVLQLKFSDNKLHERLSNTLPLLLYLTQSTMPPKINPIIFQCRLLESIIVDFSLVHSNEAGERYHKILIEIQLIYRENIGMEFQLIFYSSTKPDIPFYKEYLLIEDEIFLNVQLEKKNIIKLHLPLQVRLKLNFLIRHQNERNTVEYFVDRFNLQTRLAVGNRWFELSPVNIFIPTSTSFNGNKKFSQIDINNPLIILLHHQPMHLLNNIGTVLSEVRYDIIQLSLNNYQINLSNGIVENEDYNIHIKNDVNELVLNRMSFESFLSIIPKFQNEEIGLFKSMPKLIESIITSNTKRMTDSVICICQILVETKYFSSNFPNKIESIVFEIESPFAKECSINICPSSSDYLLYSIYLKQLYKEQRTKSKELLTLNNYILGLNPCYSSPCLNHALCRLQHTMNDTNYVCICAGEFTGINCEISSNRSIQSYSMCYKWRSIFTICFCHRTTLNPTSSYYHIITNKDDNQIQCYKSENDYFRLLIQQLLSINNIWRSSYKNNGNYFKNFLQTPDNTFPISFEFSFKNTRFLLACFVVVIIVICAILTTLCVVCCRRRKKEEMKRTSDSTPYEESEIREQQTNLLSNQMNQNNLLKVDFEEKFTSPFPSTNHWECSSLQLDQRQSNNSPNSSDLPNTTTSTCDEILPTIRYNAKNPLIRSYEQNRRRTIRPISRIYYPNIPTFSDNNQYFQTMHYNETVKYLKMNRASLSDAEPAHHRHDSRRQYSQIYTNPNHESMIAQTGIDEMNSSFDDELRGKKTNKEFTDI
ncbi:hypothetical protein SNEBB_002224 [Seison nebaliae]|nr:hypothetical protein SNEBB_002224 [Seison nebaliae]